MLERRKAREIALEILYQIEITGDSLTQALADRASIAKSPPLSDFCSIIVEGIDKHKVEIDKMIEAYADNWSIERMPILDRNIIRISLYEMLYEKDIPFSVSINEAVELAKAYGTEESSKFVNGVLGKVASNLKTGLEIAERKD